MRQKPYAPGARGWDEKRASNTAGLLLAGGRCLNPQVLPDLYVREALPVVHQRSLICIPDLLLVAVINYVEQRTLIGDRGATWVTRALVREASC